MASDTTVDADVIAVAFVVESSLAIADEWPRIIVDYVSQMIKRLSDTNPGYRLRMGFVTYATADTLPTPLLCKRFFTDYQFVAREMRENPAKLGIGCTNSGGSRGMAALEGLTAAIELFDTLRSHSPPKDSSRPSVCHIFHVAASPPDTSEHPQWNDSPLMDSVTWDVLPSELKKRNINLSSINLRPQLPRFSELHSAAAPGASVNPWFNLRAPHAIFLAGFHVRVQPKSTKRPGENAGAERTPETKRPRLSQSSASPKVPPTNTTSQPKPPLPTASQTSLPPNPPTSQVPMHLPIGNTPPRLPQQQIMDRLRSAEEQLRNLEGSIKSARAAGNFQLAETLTEEFTKKSSSHQKFKQAIATYARQQAQQLAANAQGQVNNVQQTNIPGSSIPHIQSSPAHAHKEVVPPMFGSSVSNNSNADDVAANTFPGQIKGQGSDHPPVAQPVHGRSLSNSGFSQPSGTVPDLTGTGPQGHAPRIQMSPNVASQMQKLIEQQQRNRPPQHPGIMGPNPHQNQNIQHVDMASSSGMNSAIGQPQSLPQGDHMSSNSGAAGSIAGGKPPPVAVWQGSLSWTGLGAQGKKEVRTFVVASTQNASECQADTWPSNLSLVPTREPAVSMPDLQTWMKRHKPVLCTFQASPRVSDPKSNEACYRSLVQLLTAKNLYALAGWTLPSGAQENNVLVFPINNVGLVGAFFPVAGIPEMPKALAPAPAGAQPFPLPAGGFPPQIAAQMQQLTPEQRSQVVAHLMRQKQQQQQRQAQALASQSAPNPMNTMAHAQQQHTQSQQNQTQQQQEMGGSQFGLNFHPPGGYGNGLFNSPGDQAGPSNPQNMINLGPSGIMGGGLPRPVNGTIQNGVGGNVSYEMLQSFMQRNAEGNGS